MRAKWSRYLPWGERTSATATVLVFSAFAGMGVVMVGEVISSDMLRGIGGIVAGTAIVSGCAFIFTAMLFNAVRVWRAFREVWNRPPTNRHRDWKP
jgi:hypothetical protein